MRRAWLLILLVMCAAAPLACEVDADRNGVEVEVDPN
jgi:hypothetical protein